VTNPTPETPSLRDSIIEQIRDTIAREGLKPGDRLPTEEQWAERLGVSRVSVREALKTLEYLGIVNAAPKRGTTVGTLDMDRVISLLKFQFAINDLTNEQLLNARETIESGIMPFIAARMQNDPEIYEKLYALTDLPGLSTDFDAYHDADVQFHYALIEAGNIQPLTTFTELINTFFNKFSKVVEQHGRWKTHGIQFHRDIIAALRDGDIDKAREVHHESLRVYREHPQV